MDAGSFKWRNNSIEEKKNMRKKRNKKKKLEKRKRLTKLKREIKLEEQAALEAAKRDAEKQKLLAEKYKARLQKSLRQSRDSIDSVVPVIDREALVHVEETNFKSAKGLFGKCYLQSYQGNLVVSKQFRSGVTRAEVLSEARMLRKLSHPGLPVVLGVNLETSPYIMVTLFYGCKKNNTTLHAILISQDQAPKLTLYNSIYVIKLLGEAIQYLHKQRLLHNDIKSDNVVLYQAKEEAILQPVLIDFGKACKIDDAEYRVIPRDQRQEYRLKHSHIAPEVVEGTSKQSTASDVFSLGRIVYRLGQYISSKEVICLSNSCTTENTNFRCSLSFIVEECDLMLSRKGNQ